MAVEINHLFLLHILITSLCSKCYSAELSLKTGQTHLCSLPLFDLCYRTLNTVMYVCNGIIFDFYSGLPHFYFCCLSLHQGSPLHKAAREGNMDTLKHLAIGTDVNIKDDDEVSIWNYSLFFLLQY